MSLNEILKFRVAKKKSVNIPYKLDVQYGLFISFRKIRIPLDFRQSNIQSKARGTNLVLGINRLGGNGQGSGSHGSSSIH